MLVWHKLILKCRWPYKSKKCIAKTEFIFNLKVVIIISLTKSGMNFFDWFVIVFALKYVDHFWCGVTLIPNNELFSNFTKRYQITLQINLHNDVIIISMVNILFHSHMCGWTFRKFNPLSPYDALKHHFTSLKSASIPPQLGVLEWKLPWNWSTYTWQCSLIFHPL